MPEPRFPTGSAATVGAQQGFTLLRTIVGIPPGGHGTVACVTPGGAALRQGVGPTTGPATVSNGHVSQVAVIFRCPT